jgi:bisphosphoglycerate-dependent phosphoglycerate mutase
MYLTNLCHRRRWADPLFETRQSRHGWTCRVRVNNREYTSDSAYTSEEVAREKAAESAYIVCRNFSVNDGMIPGQKQGQGGVKQGLPVAIGTGRQRGSRQYAGAVHAYAGSNSSSADSSPRTSESGLETASRRSSGSTSSNIPISVCYCQRAYVSRYQRCEYCCQENGW